MLQDDRQIAMRVNINDECAKGGFSMSIEKHRNALDDCGGAQWLLVLRGHPTSTGGLPGRWRDCFPHGLTVRTSPFLGGAADTVQEKDGSDARVRAREAVQPVADHWKCGTGDDDRRHGGLGVA
jgi:hypothetical protein